MIAKNKKTQNRRQQTKKVEQAEIVSAPVQEVALEASEQIEDEGFVVQEPQSKVPFHLPLTDLLRKRRKQLGLKLGSLSSILCIQEKYLLALEEGRFDDLPDEPYRSGFLKTYVQYLDLDVQAILQEYKAYFQQSAIYRFPEPIEEIRAPRKSWTLWAAVAIFVSCILWAYMNTSDFSLGEYLLGFPEYLHLKD